MKSSSRYSQDSETHLSYFTSCNSTDTDTDDLYVECPCNKGEVCLKITL